MRSDENLSGEFRDESKWIIDPETGEKTPEIERFRLYGTDFHKHPYSGYERNKVYLNAAGSDFIDVSGVSGADEIADSRSWVRWDFDRDGRSDIAVVNANKPLLSWFRNDTARAGHRALNGFIALRFEGASDTAQPKSEVSPRDGFGARVVIEAGGMRQEREHVCGEGYAAQNSATMLVGIGAEEEAIVTVHWPSGRVSDPQRVSAGELLRCREGRGAVRESYR